MEGVLGTEGGWDRLCLEDRAVHHREAALADGRYIASGGSNRHKSISFSYSKW